MSFLSLLARSFDSFVCAEAMFFFETVKCLLLLRFLKKAIVSSEICQPTPVAETMSVKPLPHEIGTYLLCSLLCLFDSFLALTMNLIAFARSIRF